MLPDPASLAGVNPAAPVTVAAVIVTIGRPELRAAVESVVDQTYPVSEILVVADTESELDLPTDPRVRVLRIGPGAGAGVGRQHGIEAASSTVVALLDDDDLWLPGKIERLMALVDGREGDWIAASRAEARGLPHGSEIWPERVIGPDEGLVEYLFKKRQVRGGFGFVQSSCIAFPRDLALAVPFDPSLRFHQDIGWLVDVAHARPGIRLLQAEEPLTVYTVVPSTGSVSQQIRAYESVEWARDRLQVDGSRILGDFILTQSLILAQRSGSLRSVRDVIRAGLRHGNPGWPARVYAGAVVARTATAKLRRRG